MSESGFPCLGNGRLFNESGLSFATNIGLLNESVIGGTSIHQFFIGWFEFRISNYFVMVKLLNCFTAINMIQ